MAIAGCSGSSKKPEYKPPVKTAESTPIKTGGVEITARRDLSKTDPTKVVAWVARAKSGDAELALGAGVGPTRLHAVQGEVYTGDGKVGSTFSADEGFADPATRQLELTGRVTVVSLPSKDNRDKVTLTAEKVRWLDDRGLIAAEGNVKLQRDVWTMGPSEVLWATPDLATLGSPDQFP